MPQQSPYLKALSRIKATDHTTRAMGAAAFSHLRLTRKAEDALRALALRDPSPLCVISALRALSAKRPQASIPILKANTDHPDANVRAEIGRIAEKLRDEDLRASLLKLTQDKNSTVVEAALNALGELPPDPETLRGLHAIATGSTVTILREAAFAALGSIGAPESKTVILAGMNDRPTVRQRCLVALCNYNGDDVEEALRAATKDKSWRVAESARWILDD